MGNKKIQSISEKVALIGELHLSGFHCILQAGWSKFGLSARIKLHHAKNSELLWRSFVPARIPR